jgi:hypothetical protein
MARVDGPETDVPGLIARHGLDRVAHYLTQTIRWGLQRVARKRGDLMTPEAILDDYFGRLLRGQSDELRELLSRQVMDGHHPPITDPPEQEAFLYGLFALRAGAVIELAGKSPVPDQRNRR